MRAFLLIFRKFLLLRIDKVLVKKWRMLYNKNMEKTAQLYLGYAMCCVDEVDGW